MRSLNDFIVLTTRSAVTHSAAASSSHYPLPHSGNTSQSHDSCSISVSRVSDSSSVMLLHALLLPPVPFLTITSFSLLTSTRCWSTSRGRSPHSAVTVGRHCKFAPSCRCTVPHYSHPKSSVASYPMCSSAKSEKVLRTAMSRKDSTKNLVFGMMLCPGGPSLGRRSVLRANTLLRSLATRCKARVSAY